MPTICPSSKIAIILYFFADGRNAALVWALHGYLVPTSKIIKKDVATGKKITTKFTIKDSQESVVFVGATQQEIEDRISHLKRTKVSIQPSIYAIGPNIFFIWKIFCIVRWYSLWIYSFLEGVRHLFQNYIFIRLRISRRMFYVLLFLGDIFL